MPITLGRDVCPAEDDNGEKCTHLMTRKEQRQDGMCSRCADGIWNSMFHNQPFYFKKKESNIQRKKVKNERRRN